MRNENKRKNKPLTCCWGNTLLQKIIFKKYSIAVDKYEILS